MNPEDFYAFSIDPNKMLPEARNILGKAGALDSHGRLKVPLKLHYGGIAPGVLAIHRLALLSQREGPHAQKAVEGQQIGPENEARVAVTLKDMCHSLLTKLGEASHEKDRLRELESLPPGAPRVKARAELAALRYREHVRAMLTQNERLFADMEKLAVAGLKGRDEV